MITRSTAMLLLCATTAVASAEHKLMVLKPDGNADAATKAKVDAEVTRLAHGVANASVEPGEVTFADAAAAVGCTEKCDGEVLGTLGVDELVSVTVTNGGGGDTKIAVRRIAKSSVKDATSTVPAGGALETKLDGDVGPLFGAKPAPAAAPPPAPTPAPPIAAPTVTPPAPTPPPQPAISANPNPTPPPDATRPAFGDVPPPPNTAQPPSTGPAPIDQQPIPTGPEHHSNGPLIGFGVGGGLVLLSVIMWAEASSTQNDINNAPTRTLTDFQNLQNLENRGDTYANLGNVMFVGGLVVGGISAYFFWRDHRSHAQTQAFVAPTLMGHGAGLALTIGGAP